ncbi:hypothetical protein, partial [Streptomyces sp. YS-3]|uniref:hypothetical protein n=1 Tax=Streptomyces sp. YS-3 TaxID=3381352 RepID=UPI003862698D
MNPGVAAAGGASRGAGNCATSHSAPADKHRANQGRGELRGQPTTQPQTNPGHHENVPRASNAARRVALRSALSTV